MTNCCIKSSMNYKTKVMAYCRRIKSINRKTKVLISVIFCCCLVATLTPLVFYSGKSNINETLLEKTSKKPIPLTTTRLLKSIRLNVVVVYTNSLVREHSTLGHLPKIPFKLTQSIQGALRKSCNFDSKLFQIFIC